jgi:hypothetical protein
MFALVLLVVACMNVAVFVPGHSDSTPEPTPGQLSNVCGTDRKAHAGMESSSNPQLRKLAEYEAVCEGSFTDKTMIFTNMPTTTSEARRQAVEMTATLTEFAKHSVTPLVIFEPTDAQGELLDLENLDKGIYDGAFAAYYQGLKDGGITDKTMGMWVPFPEANAPMWGTTDPAVFAANVNHVVKQQKQYFPKSQASILLNSQSYEADDLEWRHGTYSSLVPYVKDIQPGLISSFGYQGFPWLPPANDSESKPITDPHAFLQPDLAKDAADALDIKHIWFNTGTFGTAHAGDPSTEITMKAQERRQLLEDILKQVGELDRDGYEVAVHIFAEDKSGVKEGIDWSYWKQGEADKGGATPVFQEFVRSARLNGISLWLYDDDHQRVE